MKNLLDDSCVHFQEYIYPSVVKKVIDNAEKKVDDSFKKETGFCRYLNETEYGKELAVIYEEKRDWLKKIYFCDSFMRSKTPLLDMHKIAAVICRSILKLKPFAFDVKKANAYKEREQKNKDLDWLIDNYLINYKVAVDVALGIIKYDIIYKLGETKFHDEETENEKTVFPILKDITDNGLDDYLHNEYEIPSSHETFYKSLIINLMINDTNKRDFDYLGFATSCFQLQQFTVLRLYSQQKNK